MKLPNYDASPIYADKKFHIIADLLSYGPIKY